MEKNDRLKMEAKIHDIIAPYANFNDTYLESEFGIVKDTFLFDVIKAWQADKNRE